MFFTCLDKVRSLLQLLAKSVPPRDAKTSVVMPLPRQWESKVGFDARTIGPDIRSETTRSWPKLAGVRKTQRCRQGARDSVAFDSSLRSDWIDPTLVNTESAEYL
jgi:hypothetical protein